MAPTRPATTHRCARDDRRRGAVLIVALGILTILALMAAAFTRLAAVERNASAMHVDREHARMAAESGLEQAARRVAADLEAVYGNVDPAPDGVHPDLVLADGTVVSVHGEFPAPDGDGRLTWTVEAVECGGLIHLNDGDTATPWTAPATWPDDYRRATRRATELADMLNKLGVLVGCTTDRVGDVLVAERPAAGWRDLDELERTGLPADDLDLLRPHVTVHGTPVDGMVRPDPAPVTDTVQPMEWWAARAFAAPPETEARAPVNVNTAPETVLTALLWGLETVVVRDCLATEADAGGAVESASVADAGPMGRAGAVAVAVDPITRAEAEALAAQIIARREADGPFTAWEDWYWFVDTGQSVFADDAGATLAQRRRADTVRALLKAAFDPNFVSARTDLAHAEQHRPLDKTDLVRPSTELCLVSPEGVWRMESTGRRTDDAGRIAAEYRAGAVFRTHRTTVLTSQADLELVSASDDHLDPDDPAGALMSLPEPVVVYDGRSPDEVAGRLAPRPGAAAVGSGTRAMAAAFDQDLDPDVGAWRDLDAGVTVGEWTRFSDLPAAFAAGDGAARLPHGFAGLRDRDSMLSFKDEGTAVAGGTGDVSPHEGAVEMWFTLRQDPMAARAAATGTAVEPTAQVLHTTWLVEESDGWTPPGLAGKGRTLPGNGGHGGDTAPVLVQYGARIGPSVDGGSHMALRFEHMRWSGAFESHVPVDPEAAWEQAPDWSEPAGPAGDVAVLDLDLAPAAADGRAWRPGEWHHLVVQWQDGTHRVWVDGRPCTGWEVVPLGETDVPDATTAASAVRVGNLVADSATWGVRDHLLNGAVRGVVVWTDAPFTADETFTAAAYPETSEWTGRITWEGRLDDLAADGPVEVIGVEVTRHRPVRQVRGAGAAMTVEHLRDPADGTWSADAPDVLVRWGADGETWDTRTPAEAAGDGVPWNERRAARTLDTGETFVVRLEWDDGGAGPRSVTTTVEDVTVIWRDGLDVLSWTEE